jgi:hypothetical protein
MFRSLITAAGVPLLGLSALAQTNVSSVLHLVTSHVRDAGVYHLDTGTWTRHVDSLNGICDDIIYSNTCPTGYFLPLALKEYVADEGRVPGPNGPVVCDNTNEFSMNKGSACSYDVCGFQIAYCSGINGTGTFPGPVNLNVGFQGAYTACALPNVLPKSSGTFDLLGLPGAGVVPNVQGCWIVTVSLGASSPSFSLPADGSSCIWNSGQSGADHLFGWTFQNQTPVTGVGHSYVGPLAAGMGGWAAPAPTCSMVDNTRWDTITCVGQWGGAAKWPNNLAEDGWGMDNQNKFYDDTTQAGGSLNVPSGPGCYFFGGVEFNGFPWASFHLKLYANTGGPTQPGVDLCRPRLVDGTPEDGWDCPCTILGGNNQPTTPGAGCNAYKFQSPIIVPTGGALLTSLGSAVIALPPPTGLQFTVMYLPVLPNEAAFLLQGTTMISPPALFGEGLRCCGGTIKRLQIHSGPIQVSNGTSSWPMPGDNWTTISGRSAQLGDIIQPGQTRCYFVQYRVTNLTPNCVFPMNFNASQSQTILWHM